MNPLLLLLQSLSAPPPPAPPTQGGPGAIRQQLGRLGGGLEDGGSWSLFGGLDGRRMQTSPVIADLLKANDPRKIYEAEMGRLGTVFGKPYGAFGAFSQFSPKAYFDPSNYYNSEGFYNAKSILRDTLR